MKKVLIGSAAAKIHFADFRDPKDYDYFAEGLNKIETIGDNRVEYHDCNASKGLRKLFDEAEDVASPKQLYTLKVSHCFFSNVHYDKTMYDIKFFQNQNVDFDEELFDLLYKGWETIHGKKKAYLKVKNEEFFTKNVVREYVHDDLHRAIAYYDQPMFEKIKKDLNMALIDKDMFFNLPYEDQLKTCREEIYVTALERFLIPENFQTGVLLSYRRACKLLITSMTKGWFPKFIVLNWHELYKPDDHDFVNLFKQKAKYCEKIN